MRVYRPLAVLLAASALFAMSVGTAGFHASETDRSIDVGVVDDERAYLGVAAATTTGTVNGSAFELLELTDNFPHDVRVDSVSTPSAAPISIELAAIRRGVTATCTDAADNRAVTITLEVSGQGVTVVKAERVAVTCVEPTPTPTPDLASTSLSASSPTRQAANATGE